ncbi:uncharacterized protein CTHT_0012410 [Thermochaetoides thermophila DSM 1495]|uniref:uncharacterized protein n=1 Tax=Chaetomium thermophilum (strain DSM 1495 / CBS 144.50 / IMI 039719) TaxID=759272 RepID=UPI000227E120|nr:hypothetical protein CTHT_0012410 [Thermochaetoides thermophila DSM 1495]EGS22766.1 hypothetical protein CTHT_0012410 [Thermochaetoides thermophila DSM 1495]
MPPLILHNVPDDELYVGDDGIQRPFAMVFPQQDGSLRSRKANLETGAFGKSTRRTRSKAATPAKREDPTIAAADKIFSNWLASQNQSAPQTSVPAPAQRKPNLIPSSSSQNLAQGHDESSAPSQTRFFRKQEPTEVILRGYRNAQHQYAAINHYEQIAGRICEDYPREPPVESRRYKSELRDPAFTHRRALTPEERAKVNRAMSGEHWVKVTFESAEAADKAVYSSPQLIQGHLVYAEYYKGVPPHKTKRYLTPRGSFSLSGTQEAGGPDASPTSSLTADTGTLASGVEISTSTSNTLNGGAAAGGAEKSQDDEFCRVIPTVRKAKLLPMEEALLPAPTFTQRIANHIPFLRWFNGAMIGSEVPRTETGEFDWVRASLFWKLMWWLDFLLGLFGGDIRDAEKDDKED